MPLIGQYKPAQPPARHKPLNRGIGNTNVLALSGGWGKESTSLEIDTMAEAIRIMEG